MPADWILMDSTLTLQRHHAWRLGQGSVPGCLTGGFDCGKYVELDLNLIQITATIFTASSFTSTTFKHASWTGCTFTSCTFSGCDFDSLAVSNCVFTGCTFSRSSLRSSRFSACEFRQCVWDGLNFDFAQWRDVSVLDCMGTRIDAERLRGEQVDFTGSHFEHLEFSNAHIT